VWGAPPAPKKASRGGPRRGFLNALRIPKQPGGVEGDRITAKRRNQKGGDYIAYKEYQRRVKASLYNPGKDTCQRPCKRDKQAFRGREQFDWKNRRTCGAGDVAEDSGNHRIAEPNGRTGQPRNSGGLREPETVRTWAATRSLSVDQGSDGARICPNILKGTHELHKVAGGEYESMKYCKSGVKAQQRLANRCRTNR